MGKGQLENPIGILLVNILLCSAFPIIGSTNILYNRTIGIGDLPNFPLSNSGKGTDKIVNVHLSNSLSFSLTSYIGIIQTILEKINTVQMFFV